MALSNSQQTPSKVDECKLPTTHSLSIVMPAHNEEVAIAETLHAVVDAVSTWVPDYEVIVVNDGSKDSTRSIVHDNHLDRKSTRLNSSHQTISYAVFSF